MMGIGKAEMAALALALASAVGACAASQPSHSPAQRPALEAHGQVLSFAGSTREDVVRTVASWIEQLHAQEPVPSTLQFVGAWHLPPEPAPAALSARLQVRSLSASVRQVDVVVWPAGGQADQARGRLRFMLKPHQQVWTLKAPLPQGVALNCEHLNREWRSTPLAGALQVGDCVDGALGRLRRPLSAGDVLAASDVAPFAAVHEREEARVTVQVGGVRVQARARALADAQVGQPVPVKVDGVPAVLKAVVVAPGDVLVMERMQ